MEVARRIFLKTDGTMAPNGCKNSGHNHGYEFMQIDGRRYCLGCLTDAVHTKSGSLRPWFYTGSPHAAEILALDVKPLTD